MTWQLALGPSVCGLCNEPIKAGDPVLLVTAAGLRRCQTCAAAQYAATPPADWSAPVQKPMPEPAPVLPITRALFEGALGQFGKRDR